MITIKLEGFSDTFPDWLKRTLERGRYAHTNGSNRNRQAKIDWNKAEYVPAPLPTSARAKEYKDPNRLQVFLLDRGNGNTDVYIPELDIVPEIYIKSIGRYLPVNRISYKNLADMTLEYGYIDKSKYSTKDKVKGREDAKKGSIDRNRSAGQTWSEYAKTWVTHRGYDKSGYPLNPDKYISMLAKIDADDTARASRRVENYYNQIEELRNKIIKELSISSKELANAKGKGTFSGSRMSDISDALGYLDRAMSSYKELLKSIEKLDGIKGKEKQDGYKMWLTMDLKRQGDEIREYIKRANEAL